MRGKSYYIIRCNRKCEWVKINKEQNFNLLVLRGAEILAGTGGRKHKHVLNTFGPECEHSHADRNLHFKLRRYPILVSDTAITIEPRLLSAG